MLFKKDKKFQLFLLIIFLLIVSIIMHVGFHYFYVQSAFFNAINELIIAVVAFLINLTILIFFIIWRLREKHFTELELKDAEIIKSLNRVYCVLSNVNQAMVRIKEKEKLFNEICRIAVDVGGYSLCWIGIVNEETGKVNPIVNYGQKSEFLNELKNKFDYLEEELHIDEDLKNGKSVVCNDIYNNPATEQWREIAKSFELISYAKFPILDDSRIIGTLNFYSDSPNYFNDDETKLLEELAEDLSYALRHIREEEKRKEAEKELRESRQMLRLILDTIPVRVFWKDVNLNYLGCNKPFAFDAGLQLTDEIIGKNDYEMWWRKQADLYRADDKFVMESKQPKLNYEEPQTTPDGKQLWLKTSKVPLIDSEGNIKGVLGTYEDITERKLIEEALKISESELRTTLYSIGDGVIAVDVNGLVMIMNPIAEQQTGWKEEDAKGKPLEEVFKIINEETRKSVENPVRRVLREGIVVGLANHTVLISKDGKEYPIADSGAPILDSERNIRGVVLVFRDQTEERRIQKAIKESEEKFRELSESALAGVYLIQDNVFKYVNPSLANTFGYSVDEIIDSLGPLDLTYPDDREIVRKNIKDRIEGKVKDICYEFRGLRKDGKTIHVEVHGTQINYKDKLAIVGTLIDITERKEAEEALIRAKEKAEQADRIKTEFLAQVSHEIRTPINIIVGSTNLIKDSVYDLIDSENRQLFSNIESASYRITRTIDQILSMSELQIGAFQPNYKLINLKNDILNNLYKEYKKFAENKGLKIMENYKIVDDEIIADEYSVTQIFANLLDNAIKYTKEGYVEIALYENHKKEKIVEVVDTGIGISEEFLPRIFEPFVQEEQGYSRPYEGNGLGLALVKKYCELNNASISVESKKNVGTKFRVVFHHK